MFENEITLRLLCFFGVFLIMTVAQYYYPKRQTDTNYKIRWLRNLSLAALATILARVLIPFTAVGVAIYAMQQQIGLFNVIEISFALMLIVSVILLDLLIYLQHRIFHFVPLLWRLHKIHHIDQELDVTTGIRFHPLEIILSVLLKCGAVLLFGIPVMAVVIFEILLNATAMFNHSNISLPKKFDQYLRLALVTPDMHRVHHSVIPAETDSNFGFNLPWWDRLFKTYRVQPKQGHIAMQIGLKAYDDFNKTGLIALLLLPFQKTNT